LQRERANLVEFGNKYRLENPEIVAGCICS
jgi:hypothetical protein